MNPKTHQVLSSPQTTDTNTNIHSTLDSLTPAPVHPTQFRSAYSPRLRVALSFEGEGLTKQSFKDECDINILMARYMETGILDHVREEQGQFLDVSDQDYQQAMDTIANAKTLFFELPSKVRDRFENDPQKLLEFVHDPRHTEEAVELGFIDKTRLEALQASRAVPPANLTPSPSPTPPAKEGVEGAAKPPGAPAPKQS